MDRGEQFGATVDLTHWKELPARALLFGEAQGRVIVSTSMPETVLTVARTHGVPTRVIGRVRAAGTPLQITLADVRLDASLAELDDAYHESIRRIMSRSAAVQ
jgi:phosphoribosylformylglycinamidine synthase